MKFTDGFWLLKNGVRPYYALQVVESIETESAYELKVSTKPIRHRGDTLGGPVLSINVSSPSEGIICVKTSHFCSDSPQKAYVPLFPDAPARPQSSLTRDEAGLHLKTGDLNIDITTNPYTLTFRTPSRILSVSGYKHQGLFDVPYKWTMNRASNTSCLTNDPGSNPVPEIPPAIVRFINSEFTISPGELFYGAGETFGPLIKNGQSISIWNQDGGTSSEQSYKCIPFYLSNKGYGVFVNYSGEVELEVGSEKVSRLGISAADSSLEWFLIYGDTPLKILERYTLLTGRPALPPTWSFGLWLSTSFLTDYDSKTVRKFLQGMRDHKCYVDVFHFDCFWMKQYEWCSFTFDPDNFPDPKAYLLSIKSQFNVKICLWINPYISQISPIFNEAKENNYLIRRIDGTLWQWDLWQPGMGIIDITNPDTRKWYTDKLENLIDLGVDCFKTDFGERIPHANIAFYDGSDPKRMHNAYATEYNQLVFDLLERRFGKYQAVVFARSAAAGGQRFPVHWGGDCESTYEAMAEAMRGALSLTLSGFGFASHDIGGFEGTPPIDVYSRWVAFGLFSTHSRLHGSGSYRVPWVYGDQAVTALAKFVASKQKLMPYIYAQAINAHTLGHPLMRAMILEFVDDRTTHFLDQQFMLGPSLLVAPSFVPPSELTEYYLPIGKWTSFFRPERMVQGPVWVKEKIAIDDIPLWVREGTVLLLGPDGLESADYELNRDLELRIYEPQEDQPVVVSVPTGKGADLAGEVRITLVQGEKLCVHIAKPNVQTVLNLASIRLFSSKYRLSGSGDNAFRVHGNERDDFEIQIERLF